MVSIYVKHLSFNEWNNIQNFNLQIGTTQILHNQVNIVNEINYCAEKKCYKLDVEYSLEVSHISALKEASEECSQTIKFDCYLSKFSQFATWIDIKGQHHKFFSHTDKNMCNCSKDDSCYKVQDLVVENCNCDHSDPVARSDIITITDKVS